MKVEEQLSHYFFRQISLQHLSHAYIFSGDNLQAKNTVIESLIQAMVCPNFSEVGQPCCQCNECQRVIDNQISDVLYLEPDGRNIKVDQIRELRNWLNRSPVEFDFKIAIIHQADLMNPSASNALLTILEEPNSEIYIILDVIEVDSLLPTIRSRAQNIIFTNYFQDDFSDVQIAKNYQKILSLLPGTTSQVLREFDPVELEEWFKGLNEFYQLLLTKSPLAFALIPIRMKSILTTQKIDLGLDYLTLLNHQTLLHTFSNSTKKSVSLNWLQAIIEKHAISTQDLLAINQQLIEAKEYLNANVSSQLVLERIVLNLIK